MAESEDLSYSIIDDNGNKVETTYKEYDFPFYRYSKTCTVNTGTGKKNVEKKVVKKSFNEIVEDVIIV